MAFFGDVGSLLESPEWLRSSVLDEPIPSHLMNLCLHGHAQPLGSLGLSRGREVKVEDKRGCITDQGKLMQCKSFVADIPLPLRPNRRAVTNCSTHQPVSVRQKKQDKKTDKSWLF